MKRTALIYKYKLFLSVAGCSLFLLLSCGMPASPSNPDQTAFPIVLSLEDGTKTQAQFSGNPITAFIKLSDSVVFDDIAWHLGAGYYRHPDIAPMKKVMNFQVQLFWSNMPLLRDTAKKMYYDSIYVSLAGESKRSNKVTVYVTNVPPIIDSVKIGPSSFKLTDTIRYSLGISDSVLNYTFRVYAHDANRDTFHVSWFSTRGMELPSTPIVQYQLPKGQFIDTLIATAYDGKGGSGQTVIFFTKLPPNRPPVIDSIKAGAFTFAGDSLWYSYYGTTFDTINFKIYALDPDLGDSITISWANRNIANAKVRTTGTAMVWTCDTFFRDTLPRFKNKTVDTVTVSVRDSRGEIVSKSIQIVQGRQDHAPRIDSVRVDTMIRCRGAATIDRDSVSVRDTLSLKVFVSDPDSGDSVLLSVSARRPSQLVKVSDTVMKYLCRDSLSSDTLFFTARDIHGDSTKKSLVIVVANRFPVIDSIFVGDTVTVGRYVGKGADSVFVRPDTVYSMDTVFFQLFGHDPDLSDTMAVQWISAGKYPLLIKDKKGLLSAYYCADGIAYDDTIGVKVTDKKGKSAHRSVILHVKKQRRPVHTPPVIKSVRISNGAAVSSDTIPTYIDSTGSVRDTFLLRVFSFDPDSNDSVRLSVSARFPSQLAQVSDTGFTYVCRDTLYSDTIRITAKDSLGDSAKKSIVIKVTNRYPLLDSIRVMDTLSHPDTLFKGADSVFTHADSLTAKASVRLQVFSHDPDIAAKDSVSAILWSTSSKLPVKLLDGKGTLVQYACGDSTYSDTISVRVSDKKQKSAQKSLILNVRK